MNMPLTVTLDDLTAMMTSDHHHRYEISTEGDPRGVAAVSAVSPRAASALKGR